MGSAAIYQLARRGARVLGIDRFAPPHTHGSTHGETRITRLAIGEGAHYTPLVLRSHEIWRQIERETGADLLTVTGGLILSSAAKSSATHVEGFFENTVAAAEQFGIAHELLDAAAIRRRFPAFAVEDDEFAYYEREAGFLRPEACVEAQLGLAKRHGAEIRVGETVRGFEAKRDRVVVRSERAVYDAGRLVIAAGAWLPGLLGAPYAQMFRVLPQTLYWFEIEGSAVPYEPANFPVFIWELQNSPQGIYGFPTLDSRTVKIATEQYSIVADPDAPSLPVDESAIAQMHRALVAPYLPGLGSRCARAAKCLYTVTPDAGFAIDFHPESERVILASPCSGHGFKHSAAIGEILADLATGAQTPFDIGPFRLARLQ